MPSKPVAVLGKRRVPSLLQNLHHRLLDKAIQHSWDAKLSHPSIRLRDFHPPHRFRFVSPVQQLLLNSRPVLLQIVAELIDRHRSTPALPLLPLTCRNASFKFSRSHASSTIRHVLAGRSGSLTTESDSMSSRPPAGLHALRPDSIGH